MYSVEYILSNCNFWFVQDSKLAIKIQVVYSLWCVDTVLY